MKSFISALLACAAIAPSALAQTHDPRPHAVAKPGDTIDLLFINTTAQPLSAMMQQHVPGGQTTYLVNCQSKNAADCTVHDATITVVHDATYDYHEGTNAAGALTIHCDMDGKTPVTCTRTVAGGPTGYRISTSKPKSDQWSYLPVLITKQPRQNGAYTGLAAPASSSWSAGSAGGYAATSSAGIGPQPTGGSGSSGSSGSKKIPAGDSGAATLGSGISGVLVAVGFAIFGLLI